MVILSCSKEKTFSEKFWEEHKKLENNKQTNNRIYRNLLKSYSAVDFDSVFINFIEKDGHIRKAFTIDYKNKILKKEIFIFYCSLMDIDSLNDRVFAVFEKFDNYFFLDLEFSVLNTLLSYSDNYNNLSIVVASLDSLEVCSSDMSYYDINFEKRPFQYSHINYFFYGKCLKHVYKKDEPFF